MITFKKGRRCNRLAGKSRCKKKIDKGKCPGNKDWCPSRDGLRRKDDHIMLEKYSDLLPIVL